jgi:5-methylcytosine-specific restriction protein B
MQRRYINMARVTRFVRAPEATGTPQPTEVECQWRVFEVGSGRLLQLDTFGSRHRQNPGKQTLQLDENAAAELMSILQQAFP